MPKTLTLKILTGFIPFAGLVISSCSSDSDSTLQNEKPNVVMIMFDDLGWDDLGVHGNTLVETPNLDQLAASGAQFSNFYVNPVCAASRASLLTGRHFLRTGVSHVHGGKDFLSLNEKTLADVFQENGYKTAIWGKWHAGDANMYYPWQRGFDEAYKAQLYQHRHSSGVWNGESIETEKWADEAIIDHAIDFIKRNQDEPFLAYVSSLTPHSPLDAPDDLIQKYRDKGLSSNLSKLYAMIDLADQQMGRLFQTLDELELTENTIVMFFSDNGPAVIRNLLSDEDREIRYVNNYRGHKGDIWENGVKSPLFIRWPAQLKPGTVDALTDITDIFPTLLDITGIQHSLSHPLDGVSFKDVLINQEESFKTVSYNYSNKGWPPSLISYNPDGNYNEYMPVDKGKIRATNQVISVRTHRYKLMMNPGIDGNFDTHDSLVLIDMINDPKETRNLAWSEPHTTAQLRDSLVHWYRRILTEQNAYATPVIYLEEDQKTRMKATWISDLSEDLLNTVTAVKKWSTKESWIEYEVVSPIDGNYNITVEYQKPALAEPVCHLITPSQTARISLSGKNKSTVRNIYLKEGKNRIRFYIAPGINGSQLDEVSYIIFQQN